MEIFRYKLYRQRCKISALAKYLVMLCAFAPLRETTAAENEQRVSSTITNVTVFLNQAQVTRVAKVSLQPGITNLVFDRVSPFINLSSIQVKTENNITLLSVSQRNNFLQREEKPAFIIELEDTLQAVKQQIELLRIKKEALQLEKEVILANKQIGGQNSGVKIDDLEDILVLFRKRTQEIGEDLLKLSNQEKKLVAIETKLQAQIDEYLNNKNSAMEIVVTVNTLSAASNSTVEWSYMVNNASWKPFYDIRVKDTKSPLQLVSKANIIQFTGEEWKNVVLKLSTSNPNEGGTKPELQTNYLRYADAAVHTKNAPEMTVFKGSGSDGQTFSIDADAVSKNVRYAGVQQTAVNIEFNVTSAYSIPSDRNPHQVDLTVSNLDAVYAYGAVPKADKDAFVTAKVSGNDLVNQVSGAANIYFSGTYTGKTFINGTTGDSMLISLGRDKRIQIKREKLKDFSSKTFAGSNIKEVSTYEISIRNTRKEPVILIIEDQVPVSTDKEIEIKLQNAGNAVYDETTGKLSWTLQLEAEESLRLKFSFEVKYPKGRIITAY